MLWWSSSGQIAFGYLEKNSQMGRIAIAHPRSQRRCAMVVRVVPARRLKSAEQSEQTWIANAMTATTEARRRASGGPPVNSA